MKLAGLLLRERTNVTTTATTTFNSPGIYYMPYGKTTFQLQGRSTPGNPTTPGNPGNPPVPGNVSGYNPGYPGNYAYTEPGYPFEYTVYGYTGPVMYRNHYHQQNYANGGTYSYFGTDESYNFFYCQPPGYYADPSGWTVYNGFSCSYGFVDNPPYNTFYYQPPYPVYNPYTPGNPNYNPTTPGNPGNPPVPGNAGPTNNVLGVSLPGGNSDSTAPTIGFVTVALEFTNAGVPISVPSGGFVTIRNI